MRLYSVERVAISCKQYTDRTSCGEVSPRVLHHDARARVRAPADRINARRQPPPPPAPTHQQWAGSGTTPPPPGPPKTPSTASIPTSENSSSANPPSSPRPRPCPPLPPPQPQNQLLPPLPPPPPSPQHLQNTATATPTSGSNTALHTHKMPRAPRKNSSPTSSKRTNGARAPSAALLSKTALTSRRRYIIATKTAVCASE